MTDKQSAIVIRFAVQDGQKVTEALKKLEQEGTASLKKLGEGGQAQAKGLVLLQGAADELRGRMQGLAGNAGAVGTVFASGGTKALAFAAALGVVVAGLRAFISSAPQLVANADAAGLSLERYQKLRAAIIDSGGNNEQASQGLRQFAVQAKAAGLSTGELYDAIRQVNPEYARALALSKDLGEAQRIVVKAMDEAALASQKAAIGNAAFGESWRFVVAGIRREQAGLISSDRVVSPEMVQRYAEVAAKINTIADTLATRFMVALGPAVDLLAKFLENLNRAENAGVGRNGQGSERSELIGTRLRIAASRASEAPLAAEDQNFADMEQVVRKRTELQKRLDDLNRNYVQINEDFERAAERKGRVAAAGENTDQAQAVLDAARARRLESVEAIKKAQEELRSLDQQEEAIRQRDVARRRAAPPPPATTQPVPEITVTPSPAARAEAARQDEIKRLTNDLDFLNRKAAAMGEATSQTDKQRIAAINLRLAELQGQGIQERGLALTQRDIDLTRSMNLVRIDAERIAARTALGIASEEERLALKRRELDNQRRLGIIKTEEEYQRALRNTSKELREQVVAEQVRQSFTPGLTKLNLDAKRDFRLDLDEGATQSVNEFNAALFQVARGYKDAKTAALDFGVSVIAMMAQIIVKRQILGPLAGALSDGIESFAKGMFVSSANGNVVTADGPLQLSRYAYGGVHRSPGGIARRPTLSLFGEGRTPEAYVPLPDGRTIPVTVNQREAVNPVAPLSALGAPPVTMTTNVMVQPPEGKEAQIERRQNQSGGEDLQVMFRDGVRGVVMEDLRQPSQISDALKAKGKSFR